MLPSLISTANLHKDKSLHAPSPLIIYEPKISAAKCYYEISVKETCKKKWKKCSDYCFHMFCCQWFDDCNCYPWETQEKLVFYKQMEPKKYSKDQGDWEKVVLEAVKERKEAQQKNPYDSAWPPKAA